MPLYDCHLHTSLSFDSDMPMHKACLRARDLGLAGLTFTEHLEYACPGLGHLVFDKGLYEQQLASNSAAFPELTLYMGMEVGLQAAAAAFCRSFIKSGNWDFVLASVHNIDDKSVHLDEYFDGKSRDEAYNGYLKQLLIQVRQMDDFDVLAHIDLPRRNPKYQDRSMEYAEFAVDYDMLLQFLVDHGKGLEVNTAGLRYGIGGCHPALSVLRRYRDLGGDIVTCGSDAHSLQSLGYGLAEAQQLLAAAGFKYFTVFKGRKPCYLPL